MSVKKVMQCSSANERKMSTKIDEVISVKKYIQAIRILEEMAFVYFTLKIYRYFNPKVYHFNVRDFWATEATLDFVMMAYNLMSLFRQVILGGQSQSFF